MFNQLPAMKTSLVATITTMGLIALILTVATGKIFQSLALDNQRQAIVELIEFETRVQIEQLLERSRDLGLSVQQDRQFLTAFIAGNGPGMVEKLDSKFHQYFVTAGVVSLKKLYAFDLGLKLQAMSSEGVASKDIICSRLSERARQRSGASRLASLSELCLHEGKAYFATLVPVGGLRPKGYIQIVTDPAHAIVPIESVLGFLIQITQPNGATTYKSKNWPQPDSLDKSLIAEYDLPTSSGETVLKVKALRDMTDFFAKLNKRRNLMILLAGIITLLASLLAMFVLGKTTLVPIKTLQKQLRKVMADNKYLGETITVVGSPELKELAAGFNEMTKNLRTVHDDLERRVDERTASLQKSNEKLQIEINERLQTEQALILAKNDAEHANQAKSQFLSNMSHELRTPLNGILGFSQMLEQEFQKEKNDSHMECVQQINHCGWHLLDLVNDILDLARIESGKMEVNMEQVNLNTIIVEVLAILSNHIAEKEICISNQLDASETIFIHADRLRLKQILLNLISNAIKYNNQNGSVSIHYKKLPDNMIRICIEDNGRGIDKNKHSELFKPFSRLGADIECIEGTGIGLAVSKSFVEIMGGTIGMDSEPGKGSTFWFELAEDVVVPT